MENAIVLKQRLADKTSAGKTLRLVLSPKDAEGRAELLALIKSEPGTALAALQYGDQALGLTPRGSADVLEEVIGVMGNDGAASHLIEQHLTSGRVGALIAARGDLPSAIVDVATPEQLLEAIRLEIDGVGRADGDDPVIGARHRMPREPVIIPTSDGEAVASKSDDDEDGSIDELDEDEEQLSDEDDDEDNDEDADTRHLANDPHLHARALTVFRSWAYKLKDRKDFDDLLAQRVFHDSQRTFRTYVLYAIWLDAGQPEKVDEIPLDAFVNLGLEPDEGRADLDRLMSGSELSELDLDPADWHIASTQLGSEREAKARAPKTVDEAEQSKAAEAASKLNF